MDKNEKDNLEALSLDNIQDISYEILCKFDTFCKKYKLRYFLAYGTLLGAMRHKGFIPWDDDVDLWMMEEDYQRFMQLIAEGKVISKDLSVLSDRLSNETVSPFSKVFDTEKTLVYESELRNPKKSGSTGVWIDIFPLIRLPKNKIWRWIVRRILSYSFLGQRLASRKFVPGSNKLATLFRIVINPFCRCLGAPFFNALNNLTIKYSQRYLSLSDELITPASVVKIYSQNFFTDSDRSTFFKGRHFPIPAETEAILERTYYDSYPNLMKIPPEHLRVRHETQAYWC